MNYLDTAHIVEKGLIGILGIIIIFDMYLYLNKTEGDTISNILKGWVYRSYFFITYLWGVLAGHFFLGTQNPPFDNSLIGLSLILAIALLFFTFGKVLGKRIKARGQIVLLLFGMFMGHFFWSLN